MGNEKKGRVKNQHFVPRCLLSRFSSNSKTTSVFVIGSARYIPTAGIKTQCASDYYYGHDQVVENNLSRLEDAFSRAIGSLSPDTIEGLSHDDLATIRAFVHIQAERTPRAAELWRNTYVDMGRQLGVAYAKANSLDSLDIHGEAERFADHQMPIPGAHTVELAVRHQASIADLEVKFLMGDGFMISDYPTLSMNPWRDEHPRFSEWPTLGGLRTKGFMYIMPVATTCSVVIYDSDVYAVGSEDSRSVRVSRLDVMVLNALQSINASQLVFDSTVVMPTDLVAALAFRNGIRASHGDGVIALRPTGIPWGFLVVTDNDPFENWDRAMLPCRGQARNP